MIAAMFTLLALLACNTPTDTTGAFDTHSDSADSADSADTGAGTELTLENCPMTVESDVPAFYSTFFRCSEIALVGDTVQFHTHNLPPHKSGYYPEGDPNWEAWDDRGGEYEQNPNTIATQDTLVWVPTEPVARGIVVTSDLVDGVGGTNENEYPGGPAGIGLDGVVMFSGAAGPDDDIAEEQYTFDSWDGHPEMTGVYHHHSPNPADLAVMVYNGFASTNVAGSAEIELYGIACDGTVVLGCTELDGSQPETDDFDAQNGHVRDLVGPDGSLYFTDRYHTHVCPGKYSDAYFPEVQYYDGCEVL
jgi:hypothetical protein